MKIFKYLIDPTKGSITLPKTFTPLFVKYQESSFGNGIYLWGELDANAAEDKESMPCYTFVTGEEISDLIAMKTNYFGTVETPNGIMLHVYLSNKAFQNNVA